MYQISDKYYINTNHVAKMNILTELDGKERYFLTMDDGTRHEIPTKAQFEEIAELAATVTYSDAKITDNLQVGDIADLEDEINKIKNYSDVKDVVGTYAELMAYDTSTLNLNDVIEVLNDENEDNKNTMYKWNGTSFDIIGSLGPYYTKAESDARYPTSIQYDSTNKKITQTKNNTISDIVTVSTLKTDMELNNVVNTGDSDTPVSGGTTKFTTGGAYTELNKKVEKTTTVNGHQLNENIEITKTDVGLGNVSNDKQIRGIPSGTTENNIITFGNDGYNVKDSGKSFTTAIANATTASDNKIATEKAIRTELDTKVDKEPGKGLSTNDYVTVDKEYLENLRTTLPNVNDTTIALTYSQIKTLKDNNQLIAGRTYRITDYSTMTIDTETRSVGNDFDIILKANTTNSFDPICSAHVRTGTNYFTQSYISQWILWYNFDNDTNLCSWVDNTCKGYIYRMIDEYNNDLPYDFKNIQFKRYKIVTTTYNTYSNLVGMYLGNTSPYGYTIDSSDFVWRYTFVCSDALDEDLSNKHIEVGEFDTCRYVKQIKIGTRLADSPYRSKLQLNNNVFISGNIMCDMTFGNQTHINTIQVVNDISYNYFGSMMRRNLIYVTDFNHNNIRECFEDNLIGSGTQMFSWNWVGDHCANNIIQGMTLVYCLGYLRYVKADSPNLTFNNVQINETYAGSDSNPYSVFITNAIEGASADIRTSKFGTLQKLKLDHSAMAMIDILYILDLTVTGRPIYNVDSNRIEYTEIYFNEAVSAVSGWEFKDCRGSSSSYLTIDFRETNDILVNNAIKTYDRQIYSVDSTLTGYSGVFSYKVYDTINNFDTVYIWSAMLDDLTPTANIIAKDLTRHEIVNRVDSNYEIVDNILINAIDKIDPTKDYEVTNHINEPTYRFTAPLNSKLLMLQSIAGNSNKIAPSTPSDDSVARLKVIPENTYKSQIDYIGGKSCKYNQLVQNGNYTATLSNAQEFANYINDTNQLYNLIANHKYLILTSYDTTKCRGWRLRNSVNGYVGTTYTTNQIISNITSTDSNYALQYQIEAQESIERKLIIIDLTDKFGAGNEPSTVETAIPLLKANGYKLDGTDTYSTGSLKHAITTSIVYSGNYCNVNDSIVYAALTFQIASDLPIGTYTFKIIDFNDANTNYAYNLRIGNQILGTTFCNKPLTITTTEVGNIYIYVNTANALNYKIMLIKGTTAPSTYIPYIAPITKEIPSQVLADNRYGLGFDNSNYNHLDSDGHLRGSYAIVDLSTLTWNRGQGNVYSDSLTSVIKAQAYNVMPNLKAEKYPTTTTNNSYVGAISLAYVGAYVDGRLFVYVENSETAPLPTGYLVYELATSFDQDYSQYFTDGWNKVDLDKQYATCKMVVAEPIDMPNKVEYYGTIIHSLATAVKQDGFNVFNVVGRTAGTYDSSNPSFSDEKYYSAFSLNGNYYASGASTLTSTSAGNVVVNVVNAGYGIAFPIKVIAGETYHIDFTASSNNTNVGYFFVDYNGNKTNGSYSNTSYNVNIPNNCEYLVLVFGGNSTGAHTFSNICINISNQDLNGTYKPYKAPITRLLPNSEAKYSWGITDGVRNTRVFCDDECNPVNEGSLAVGNNDLGSLTYFIQNDFFFSEEFNIKTVSSDNDIPNVLISTYTTTNYNDLVYSGNDKVVSMYSILPRIAIRNSAYSTTEAFKTAMDGVPLFYEKNTTDSETLDDFDYFFDCEEGDTFTLVNTEQLQCYATYSFLIESEEI